jgi:hypothetical protein
MPPLRDAMSAMPCHDADITLPYCFYSLFDYFSDIFDMPPEREALADCFDYAATITLSPFSPFAASPPPFSRRSACRHFSMPPRYCCRRRFAALILLPRRRYVFHHFFFRLMPADAFTPLFDSACLMLPIIRRC